MCGCIGALGALLLAACGSSSGGELRADAGAGLDSGADAGPATADAAPASRGCGTLEPTGDATWNLTFGGLGRSFHVHVPASYAGQPTPLVLDFHGYTSNGDQEVLLTGMNAKADAAGFIAVHPDGTGSPTGWNAGACCGSAATTGVDDVGFVRAMLTELESRLCVDQRRVFATGMSNGGFLSHRLGCELADRIAAIAPVAGVMGVEACTPARAIPVLDFHGTADMIVPYAGNPAMGFKSVADTMAGWAERDGCGATPERSFMMADMHCETYPGCRQGAEVTLCTVEGGGHTWPGGLPIPTGVTSPVKATDLMWTFFSRHPLE
jgi:polyhydroxybutyrate depolymerase